MACLDQLLTAITSLIIFCDHIRSKTRLIAIAKPGIIYTSLHKRVGLSEYQLSLPPHQAYYYIQTRHGKRGRWGVESQLQQQRALGLCSVLCWQPLIASRHTGPSCRHLLDRVPLTAAHWSTNSCQTTVQRHQEPVDVSQVNVECSQWEGQWEQ